MHHGTCVTHVPWCMSGSRTCGDGENIPGIPGACAPAILRIWQEAHGTGFWLCAVFLAVSLCVPFTISMIEFYFIIIFIMIVVTVIWICMAILSFWTIGLGFLQLSSSASANAQLPGCVRPGTFSLNIWIEHVTFGLLYVIFTSPTRIF